MADLAPLTPPRTRGDGWRDELRATLRLSWPLATANLLQMLTYAIDVIFIARLGEDQLAASALAVAVFGLATIIFGLSQSMPLSLAMLVIVGAADMFSVYIRQSLIQLHTPDDKRGRVSSVSLLTISASNEFGDFFSGSLAFLIGPVFAVVGGGVGAIVTVAIWARIFPVLRTTRTFDPPEELLDSPPEEKLQEQMP